MRPVFEKGAILFQQRGQVFAPVGLVAGEQDLVMGALDRLDAVDLHEAELMDELQEPVLGQGAIRRCTQPLFGNEDAAGIGIREQIRHVLLPR